MFVLNLKKLNIDYLLFVKIMFILKIFILSKNLQAYFLFDINFFNLLLYDKYFYVVFKLLEKKNFLNELRLYFFFGEF